VSIRVGASVLSKSRAWGFSFAAGPADRQGPRRGPLRRVQFSTGERGQLSQFIDFGTSQAFFTFVARHQRPSPLPGDLQRLLALQFVVVVAAAARSPQADDLPHYGSANGGRPFSSRSPHLPLNEVWEAVSQLGEARLRTVVVQQRSRFKPRPTSRWSRAPCT